MTNPGRQKTLPGYFPYLLLAAGTCGLLLNEFLVDISRMGVILCACCSALGLALLVLIQLRDR